MRGLIATAARHPVLANLMMAVIIIAGVMCFSMTRRELMPEVSANRVIVTVAYPGFTAPEVETGIVVKIEEAIKGVAGIKNVDSSAADNVGTIVVEIDDDAVNDHRKVLDDVRDRVEATQLPPQAERPIINEFLLKDDVMLLTLAGRVDEALLRDTALDVKDELLRLGVSQIELIGIRDREISVEVSEEALRRYRLSLDQVAQAVAAGSQNISAGTLRTDAEHYRLEVRSRRYSGAEYEQLPVLTSPDGAVVRLRDVATVRDRFVEDEHRGRNSGDPAVLFDIKRTGLEDATVLAEAIRAYIDRKNTGGETAQEKPLPAGLTLSILGDFTTMIDSTMRILLVNGAQGLALLFLALWLFLGLRLSLWVAVGIPISFAFAGILIYMAGESLNTINLFGLILVLGIVVDDAIVVGENIHTHRQMGKSRGEAAVDGAYEMFWPVLAAVTTTIIAFMPLFFVAGILGKFIAAMPLAVIATLLGSLLESFFILPNHLAHGSSAQTRPRTAKVGEAKGIRAKLDAAVEFLIHRIYSPVYRLGLKFRYSVIALAIAALALAGGLVAGEIVPQILFDDGDTLYLRAEVEFPEGTPLSVTEGAIAKIEAGAGTLAKELESRLVGVEEKREQIAELEAQLHDDASGLPPDARRRIREHIDRLQDGLTMVTDVFSVVGGANGRTHRGEVWIAIPRPEDRNIHSRNVVSRWRETVGPIDGSTTLAFAAMGGMGPPGEDIEVFLSGRDLDALQAAADELKAKLGEYPGVFDIRSDVEPGMRELRVSLSPTGRLKGLTEAQLGEALREAFYGEEALEIQRGRDEVEVRVRYPVDERRSIADLTGMRIRTPTGEELPFREVATFDMTAGVSTIRRRNGARRTRVYASTDEDVVRPAQVLAELRGEDPESLKARAEAIAAGREPAPSFIDELEARHNVVSDFEGAEQDNIEAMNSLVIGFAFAAFAIYAVLTIVFRSWLQPVLIMATIPFGIAGAVFGHFVFGMSLTLMSIFGIVALAGVVVNDALVLINRTNAEMRRGATVLGALHTAGPARFRAIILTSATTVAGLSPLLADPSYDAQFLKPMALSLSAGLLFATFLTLFVVPSLLLALNDVRRILRWLRTGYWSSMEVVEPACRQRIAESDGPTGE
jgi:multidrug efflux pump subunit AcrB